MATVKKGLKKAQLGSVIKGALKGAAKEISDSEISQAFKLREREALKSKFKEIDRKASAPNVFKQQAKRDLKKAIEKRTNPPKKSSYEDQVWDSYQKNGGKTPKAKDGKWIQKAVNPKHKGFCTPLSKATCTPKRKALAKTFKAMGKARKGK